MSAIGFDLRQPELVAHELAEANRRLAREAETPASVLGLVEGLVATIAGDDDDELAVINPWLWIRLQGAALRAQSALTADDPDRRRQLRLALEQMRFLFARIADRQPLGEDRSSQEIVRWVEEKLPSVPQKEKASLLGIGVRTYQRWVSEREPTLPSGDDDRRLRVVARIINQLRHSLTGPGVVDWFGHPRLDLDHARPVDLLEDPERLQELLAAAAASRGNVAA